MNKAKEYLSQIRSLDSQIRRRQQEIEELREAAMSTGGMQLDAEKVRTDSPDPDPIGTKVSRYMDLQQEVEGMIWELTELKHEIIGNIQLLGDTKYMDVLWKRYVDLKSFKTISCEMNYSEVHIKRLHGQALQMFNEKFTFIET